MNEDIEGACNRAYYAVFDAANAALLRSGAHINPAEIRTHSGLIGAFGKHLVKPGLASTELGRALNQVERIRLLADHTGETIDADKAVWAIEQADTFLKSLALPFRNSE